MDLSPGRKTGAFFSIQLRFGKESVYRHYALANGLFSDIL
jgi:hypothetical protein